MRLKTTTDRLRRDVPGLLAEHDVPGLAIGICDASGLRWSAGFGHTTRGGAEVTPSTMFSIQSVSKLYTSTVIMTAVRDGLLDLDEPITSYLPDFTVHSSWERHPERRMTLRLLLSHRAGFTHEAPIGSNYHADRSWAAHLRSISDSWLRFPVGHHYEYSNLGIDLAAHALESVTGRPFLTLARERLLEPLGLRRTTFDQRAIMTEPDRARGHDPQVARLPVWIPMIAAGGVYSGIDDACRFVSFHLAGGEGILTPELLREQYAVPSPEPDQDLGYGLAVRHARWDDRVILGHGGGGYGFTCYLGWAPRDGVGVVVLTNSSGSSLFEDLCRRAFRELLGAGAERAPLITTRRPRIESSYAARGAVTFSADQLNEEEPGTTFRQDGDWLIQNDGLALYRNDPIEIADDQPVDGPWNRDYTITIAGSKINSVRLLRRRGAAAIEFDGERRLALRRHRTDLYFCTMGEALDLSGDPITYANIALRPA
ncbi:serine hydrolase domain-containing protein [Microlunatus speluncae]|uniref:serine hydrolase domain-containing protein n=1 Tax=Microlunatus speluncae TaxID=2594267 RepID=UPI0013760BB1|nr:serine hydrolase domain-containing protein [Microlunatus speluncae]